MMSEFDYSKKASPAPKARHSKDSYRIHYLYRPGRRLTEARLNALVAELREVAATCFEEIPDYQCLRGTREELSDKVITTARCADGTLAGFCSAVLLPAGKLGSVLHLGLTCVRPDDRSAGLTHRLMSKAMIGYLLRRKPLSRVWVSNVACVLSSLGNVALHFDDVYPSPHAGQGPSLSHLRIADAIDRYYRDKIHIDRAAQFDPDHFVFRRSVRQTVFQKEATDRRYRHRQEDLNRYYEGIMQFEEGDEVVQVGHYSLLTGLRYWLRSVKSKSPIGGTLRPGIPPQGEQSLDFSR